MKFTIKNESIQRYNGIPNLEFPKYTSQLINWANQNAQGTRPKVVGQLSDLFPEFQRFTEDISIEKWEEWYLKNYPNAIDFEMSHKTPALSECINAFQRQYLEKQKPLVLQTIWKTQGQSPVLADNAFDIVVWSDYAFSRLFVDSALSAVTTMSRPMRASAKLARCLWELSKSGKIRLAEIYRQMAFDTQTDKEFAINGQKWRGYVSSERILKPILHKNVLNEIIEPGFIERLRPERRFDQTLYFTVKR